MVDIAFVLLALGLLVGRLVINKLGWRRVCVVNVPLAGAVVAVALHAVPAAGASRRRF